MTTRTDRIRQHLERHEYAIEFEAMFWRWSTADSEGNFESEDECLEDALTGFLNDASKTGARIQDLINHGPGKEIGPVQIYGAGYFDSDDPTNTEKHWRGYCTSPSDEGGPTGNAKTVDASIADCWRRVFIDPEDNQ